MDFASLGARAVGLGVNAVIGGRAALDLLQTARQSSDELDEAFSTVFGRMSSLHTLVETLENNWGNEKAAAAAGGASAAEKIRKGTDSVRRANAEALQAERARSKEVKAMGGALAGWAAAVGTVATGAAARMLGSDARTALGAVSSVSSMFAKWRGARVAKDVDGEEDPAAVVRRAWSAALAEGFSSARGTPAAERRLEMVLHLVIASVEGSGELVAQWAGRWKEKAPESASVRSLTVFREPEVKEMMHRQVQAVCAGLEEARSQFEGALLVYLAEKNGSSVEAVRRSVAAQLAALERGRDASEAAKRSADRAADAVESTAAKTHDQLRSLDAKLSEISARLEPVSPPTGMPVAKALNTMRVLAVHTAIAAERSNMKICGIDAAVLSLFASNPEHYHADPLLGLKPIKVWGVGAEGAVLACTTEITGHLIFVALKCITNEDGRRSSSIRSIHDPFANEYRMFEKLGRRGTYPSNVLRMLATFVARPSEDMIDMVVQESSLSKRQLESLLRDSNDDPRPMRMLLLPQCRGGDLESFLRQTKRHARRSRSGGIEWILVVSLLRGIADGIAQLRANGIVHMDSKLQNVLVDVDTDSAAVEYDAAEGFPRSIPRAVVCDLGAARVVDPIEEDADLSHLCEGVQVPCSLGEARARGRSDAEEVDAAFPWDGVRDAAGFRGVRGNFGCRAPEVLAGSASGPWNLVRQPAFELGVLMWDVLTAKHPVDGYVEDEEGSTVEGTGGKRTVVMEELPELKPSMGKICDAPEADFEVLAMVARELVHPDPRERMSVEEARSILWWLWERCLGRYHGALLGDEEEVCVLEEVEDRSSDNLRGMSLEELWRRVCTGSLAEAIRASVELQRRRDAHEVNGADVEEVSSSCRIEIGRIRECVACLRGEVEGTNVIDGAVLCKVLAISCINKKVIGESGGIDALVHLVWFRDVETMTMKATLENLVEYAENRKLMIKYLIRQVEDDDGEVRSKAAEAFRSLASCDTQNRNAIRECGGIDALVRLVSGGDARGRSKAAWALSFLADNDAENRKAICECGGIDALVRLVSDGDARGRSKAAWALSFLTDNDAENRKAIRECGGIDALVRLVSDGDAEGRSNAARALWNIAENNLENRNAIRDCDGIKALVRLVSDEDAKGRSNAAGALWTLAMDDENCKAIRDCDGIDTLMHLLSYSLADSLSSAIVGTLSKIAAGARNRKDVVEKLVHLASDGNFVCRSNVATALRELAEDPENRTVIRECGGIDPLVRLISDGEFEGQLNAAEALQCLALDAENRKAIRECGGIDALVRMASNRDEKTRSNAAAALRNLAENDIINRMEIVRALVHLVEDRDAEARPSAAWTLRFLAVDDENCNAIRECGGIDALVCLVSDGDATSRSYAAAALANLSIDADNRRAIRDCDGIKALVRLVSDGDAVGRYEAALGLLHLTVDVESREALLKHDGIVPLVHLVSNGDAKGRLKAAGTLLNLSFDVDTRRAIRDCGGIKALVRLVSDGDARGQLTAAETLRNLAVNDAESQNVIRECSGIDALIRLVSDRDAKGRSNAAGALWNLAADDENRKAIRECGGIDALVQLVSDGDAEGQEYARGALSLLQ